MDAPPFAFSDLPKSDVSNNEGAGDFKFRTPILEDQSFGLFQAIQPKLDTQPQPLSHNQDPVWGPLAPVEKAQLPLPKTYFPSASSGQGTPSMVMATNANHPEGPPLRIPRTQFQNPPSIPQNNTTPPTSSVKQPEVDPATFLLAVLQQHQRQQQQQQQSLGGKVSAGDLPNPISQDLVNSILAAAAKAGNSSIGASPPTASASASSFSPLGVPQTQTQHQGRPQPQSFAGQAPILTDKAPNNVPASSAKPTSPAELLQLQQLAALYLLKQKQWRQQLDQQKQHQMPSPLQSEAKTPPSFSQKQQIGGYVGPTNPQACAAPFSDAKRPLNASGSRAAPSTVPEMPLAGPAAPLFPVVLPNAPVPTSAPRRNITRRPDTDPLLFIQPNAKYTVSLNGRFWSLNEWPTGRRDEDHNLTFGKHKLDVTPEGIIRVVLYGGVGRYTVKLHICLGDDVLGQCDEDGWTAAIMGPNCSHFELVAEAKQMGWQALRVGSQEPLIVPPHLAKNL